jgi:hypothetical protein
VKALPLFKATYRSGVMERAHRLLSDGDVEIKVTIWRDGKVTLPGRWKSCRIAKVPMSGNHVTEWVQWHMEQGAEIVEYVHKDGMVTSDGTVVVHNG